MPRRYVTNHEHARMVALARQGHTLDYIAAMTDRSIATVSRHTTGLPRNQSGGRRSFDYAKAAELHDRYNLSYRTLAERFGVTPTAVCIGANKARRERQLREAA